VFLVIAAVFGKNAHRSEISGLDYIGAARAYFGHSLNCDDGVGQGSALAAI